MGAVLLRAVSFSLIFIFGILFRSSGFVSANAVDTVKKLAFYLTIPSAIITSFSKVTEIEGKMVAVVGIGILVNVLLIAVGAFLTRGQSGDKRALYMVSLPAYGLGTFTIPFVQSFLPPIAAVTANIFDVGNSIMCVGVTPAFTAEYLSGEKNGFNVKAFAKRLCSSAPLITYIVMYFLTTIHIRVPEAFLALIQPMANSNAFMCMMMLGLLFRMELKREYLGEIAKLVLLRNLFSAIFALVFYFCLPFDLYIRQALVLLVFSPAAATAPAFVGICGGDEGLASAANGASIILGIAVLTMLLGIMGFH